MHKREMLQPRKSQQSAHTHGHNVIATCFKRYTFFQYAPKLHHMSNMRKKKIGFKLTESLFSILRHDL